MGIIYTCAGIATLLVNKTNLIIVDKLIYNVSQDVWKGWLTAEIGVKWVVALISLAKYLMFTIIGKMKVY